MRRVTLPAHASGAGGQAYLRWTKAVGALIRTRNEYVTSASLSTLVTEASRHFISTCLRTLVYLNVM